MAKYKLPGTYCRAARDKITQIILDWSKYKSDINIETEVDTSGTGFGNYIITIVAPTNGQDELVEDVTKLVFSEFNNLVYDKNIFLSRCFDDFKKSKKKKPTHLLQYADRMRYGKIVREYLGTEE